MTLAIMQPYLLPYIGYWQLMNAVDTFVIYDDVNYIKQGYINRNHILTNGQFQPFTLEVIGASSNKLINQIHIGNNGKKILKTIVQNYKKAPYFVEIFPLIENILTHKEENLAKFIGHSLEKVSQYLEMDIEFIYSSDVKKDNRLKAQDKVLDICKTLHATSYINTMGGQKLYDKEVFRFNNLNLYFLQTDSSICYQQFDNEFVSNLSIIDILMFNDIAKIQTYLKQYKLI